MLRGPGRQPPNSSCALSFRSRRAERILAERAFRRFVDFPVARSRMQSKGMASPKKKKTKIRYVVVKNQSYGEKLRGSRIYYEGKKPKQLQKDGRITFGKHILEFLKRRLPKS